LPDRGKKGRGKSAAVFRKVKYRKMNTSKFNDGIRSHYRGGTTVAGTKRGTMINIVMMVVGSYGYNLRFLNTMILRSINAGDCSED
jgi:cyanophycinase-like exopeptidase